MRFEHRKGAAMMVGALVMLQAPRALHAQGAAPSPRCDADVVATDTTGARNVGALRSGDLLKINVFRLKEFSGDYIIDSQGRIVIPGLGIVRTTGLQPPQVEARLRGLLECRGYSQDASVLSVQPQVRISVLGEVRNPGLFPVDPGVGLLQVITLAGGETGAADLSHTRVVREGRTYTVDLRGALNGAPTGQIALNSNDVVVVPKKKGFSREDASFTFGALSTLFSIVSIIVTLRRN
ncbi:MAG: hypothetical protein JWO05_2095 [Gemmatimonadetes bacterium]|nr:hypothetical protein [Gemmatimonadota bacterium]